MAISISITGHRRLEDAEQVRTSIQQKINNILAKKKETGFNAYSSLAAGSDCIFAAEAIKMEGTLKVVLPFAESEYIKDFHTDEARVFTQLRALDTTPVITTEPIPKTNDKRNEAYLTAGKYIVDKCDYLIAVWDGEKSSGKGGTADIVEYARTKGKTVIHILAYRSDVSRLFLYYDKKAIHSKRLYEWLWKTSILCSLLAAIILAVGISLDLTKFKVLLASLELLCMIIALSIIFILKKGKLNRQRIAFRRSAERLRVIEKFDASSINMGQLDHFPGLPREVAKIEEKYKDIPYPKDNFEKNRQNLLRLISEQITYHTNNRPEIKARTFHRLEKSQLPLLVFFAIGVLLHFGSVTINESHLAHLLHATGLLLSLSIPPIYAAIEGYIYFKEYHKIFMDSEKMSVFLKHMKEEIETIDHTDHNKFTPFNNFAFQVMKNMDAETKEWGILVGQKTAPGI